MKLQFCDYLFHWRIWEEGWGKGGNGEGSATLLIPVVLYQNNNSFIRSNASTVFQYFTLAFFTGYVCVCACVKLSRMGPIATKDGVHT